MFADDAMLFIDANSYLDLYRTVSGKKLLAALTEQANHIFVTRQVVDEVQRNSLNESALFLTRQIRELEITERTYAIPDHLFGENPDKSRDIKKQMKDITDKISKVNQDANALAMGIIQQISKCDDEVSKALAPIFANAVVHTEAELVKAKERKERGNPPGKKTDPIGDELSWEQILSHFTGKKRIWIISKDGDFGTVFMKTGFLKPFLYDELRRLVASVEAYLFNDINDGIKDFAEKTGVPANKLPTPEEAREIKKEIERLPKTVTHPSGLAFDDSIIHVPIRMYAGDAFGISSIFGKTPGPEPLSSIFGKTPGPESLSSIFGKTPGPESLSSIFGKTPGPESLSSIFGRTPGPESLSSILGKSSLTEGFAKISFSEIVEVPPATNEPEPEPEKTDSEKKKEA
jgi:hypothetical protein